jgi:hypothetical protein
MQIPKKLRVGGFFWRVLESEEAAIAGNCFGETQYGNLTLIIDPTLNPQKRDQTLLHEILHACMWQSGLEKRMRDQSVSEEDVVTALSMQLYQVLKDNKLHFDE